MMKKKASEEKEVNVIQVHKGIVEVCIVGRSPLIFNRMSQKAKQELIYPHGPKTLVDKCSKMKHNPLEEYRDSPYRNLGKGPTRLQGLASWFKGTMKTAALDLPGMKKTEIGRRIWVVGDRVNIYGVPQMFMAVTRNSGFPPTPDVRTRAILPRWACRLAISFVTPLLKEGAVLRLQAAGGYLAGVGDWRPEKGSGNYGQFELVASNDPEFLEILKEGGREAQDAALENPTAYDDETATLFAWFEDEVVRRNADKVDDGIKKISRRKGDDSIAA